MRPANLKTTHPSFRSKIFLDGGDPNETREIINLLGFLDGQTTNPTLISKNQQVQKRLSSGEKFSREEILEFYKNVIKEISNLLPDGSVSVEVYSDGKTQAEEMLTQGQQMYSWIPNAHIKFPTSKNGLQAAELAVKKGMRVNLTLCFSQEQAAAVYCATKEVRQPGQVFVSPFVGRLDDIGFCGMDLIKNIIKMYETSDHHVEVLTASVRNLDHFLYALALGSDIISAPFQILKQWAEKKMEVPGEDFKYLTPGLKEIPYFNLDLNKNWTEFNLNHELTTKGITKFSEDWNNLIVI